MYLKRISICNFMSYSGITVIDDIGPSLNAFVGQNGVGKSNIFQALQFVLIKSSKPTNWRDLLPVVSARKSEGYVELLFTDCNALFEGEITIKKTFSMRKCGRISLFINGTKLNQSSISNLLEVCKFQFCEPIFIKNKQMVHRFVKFSSEEKLDFILKNLGYTYYECYHSAANLFQAFEDKKEKIDHLRDLCKTEINEVKQQYLSRRKTLVQKKLCLIYNVCSKNIIKWQIKKSELESSLKSDKSDTNVKGKEKEMKEKISEILEFILNQEELNEDLSREELDLSIKNDKLMEKLKSLKKELEFLMRNDSSKSEISKYDQQIYLISEELQNTEKILLEDNKNRNALLTRLVVKKQERLCLIAKNEKQEEFIDEAIRLNWLETKKRSIDKQRECLENDIKNIVSANNEHMIRKQDFFDQINAFNKSYTSINEETSKTLLKLKIEQNHFHSELCKLRRREYLLENEMNCISKNIQEVGLKLQKKIGSNIIKGCESVLRIIEHWKSSGNPLADQYFGIVVENIKCSDSLNIAIETAVGNKLFSHIVSNNVVGTNILKEMRNNNLPGEVWFIPMNVIKSSHYNFPHSENSEPLLNKLEYLPAVKDVMRFLFGGILICKDLETAICQASKSGVTCVTVQGDRVTRRRDLYGGYFNANNSSRNIFMEIQNHQDQHFLKEAKLNEIRTQINAMETKMMEVSSNIQKTKALLHAKSNNTEIESFKNEINLIEKALEANNRMIERKECLVRGLDAFKAILKEDITQELIFDHTEFNVKLKKLNHEIFQLEKAISEAEFKLFKSEQEKSKLEYNIQNQMKHLLLNTSQMEAIKKCSNDINDTNIKLSVVKNRLNKVQEQKEQTKNYIFEATKSKIKVAKLSNDLLDMASTSGLVLSNQTESDKIRSKINIYENKISSCYNLLSDIQKNYNEVVEMPNNYKDLSISSLLKELKEIKVSIMNLEEAHQNMLNTTDGFKFKLSKRFKKLENNFSLNYTVFSQFIEWIHNFIEMKLESISEVYSEIFHKLTSGNEGYLFADNDGSTRNWPVLPETTGINMCVGWRGAEYIWDLQNMSYGQKVCAVLALCLSIVRVSSTPIFIMDEIDLALSSEERRVLIDLLQSLGELTQIFLSAHALEDVSRIQSQYSVEMKGMSSCIKKVMDPLEISSP